MRRGAGQPDRQVRLADPGRPNEQHIRRCLEISAGRQLGNQLPIDTGGGVVVEVVERGRCQETRKAEPARQSSGFGGIYLDGQQPVQGGGHRQVLRRCLIEDRWQRLGGIVELEDGGVPAQPLIETGRVGCARRRKTINR